MSSPLITQLKADHAAIQKALDTIREASFQRAVSERELTAIKDRLLAHLAKEDKQLYPVLLSQEANRRTAEKFQERMQPISTEVLAFFTTYQTPESRQGMAFAKDLGRLMQRLTMRIRDEETHLYPLMV
jgi:hemerythrin-like domain-containing protein